MKGCGVQLRDGTIVVGIFFNNLYAPDGSYTNSADVKDEEIPGAWKALSRSLCHHF